MKNLLKFLSKSKGIIVIILALLCVQAYCDLALPTYTSNILNVGLQQGGIEDALLDTVQEDSLKTLELFMTEEEVETVEAAYSEADTFGIRTLEEEADQEEIEGILLVPECVVYMLSTSEEYEGVIDQLLTGVEAGLITREDVQEQLSAVMEEMEDLTDTYLTEIAVYYVQAEYEAQGVDLDALQTSYLWRIGGRMLLMACLMMAVSLIVGLMASVVSSKIGRDLRRSVYEKVMGFTNAEMGKFSTASLITRSTNDIQQVQMVIVMLLRMVLYAPVLGIGGIIMVIKTGSGMSWIIVLAVIILSACVGVLFAVAMPKFKVMQQKVDRLNLVSRELLTGVMPIRAFSREKHEEERFEEANSDLYRTQLFTNRTMTFMSPIMMFIMNGISVLIVWVGAHGVDEGTMQVGDLTAFITYSMVIVMGFLMIAMVCIMVPRAGVAADRIVEVINTPVTLKDPENPEDAAFEENAAVFSGAASVGSQKTSAPEAVPAGQEKTASAGTQGSAASELSAGAASSTAAVPGTGVLSFNDVSFTYPGADEPAIEHISFTAEPGKTTAIIGSTGCGKTTLLNLIPRFYDVTKGSVTIDGIDIRNITQHKLRSMLGYVPQKGVLFSGTIESNLKYGGEQITDEDIQEAAEIAQATEFISAKHAGYQSPIAQGGTNVSGGQKQRLSIARAIAKHPKIYLFDDSFSALDYKTDLALRKALSAKTKDATVIIVAQRISTILHADQILVLDEGRVVGVGTHEELLERCSTYQEIARSQLSQAELAGAAKGGAA